MTLRDDYEHWARSFVRRMGDGWGVFLDRLYAKNSDNVTWDDVRVSAEATKPGSSAPTWAAFISGLHTYLFANAQSNYVEFNCQIPHGYKEGSDIYPHVHWGPQDATSGDVRWSLEYSWAEIGEAFGASTTIYSTDAASGTTRDHQIAVFDPIDGARKGLSSMLICRLTRLGSAAEDTYGSGAWFYEFDFHIQKDTVGSFEEYTK